MGWGQPLSRLSADSKGALEGRGGGEPAAGQFSVLGFKWVGVPGGKDEADRHGFRNVLAPQHECLSGARHIALSSYTHSFFAGVWILAPRKQEASAGGKSYGGKAVADPPPVSPHQIVLHPAPSIKK